MSQDIVYAYLDESGDLGFDFRKGRTSRFFVMSLVIAGDEKIPSRIIKKIIKSLPPRQTKQHTSSLHAYKEKKTTRAKLLKLVENSDAGIFIIALDKQKERMFATTNKHKLYTSMAAQIVEMANIKKGILYAAKRETKTSFNEKFIKEIKSVSSEIDVKIKYPHENGGIQIADFIANAFWLAFEKDEIELADIIKDKTLVAFAGIHPVPRRQGNYLSYNHYSKSKTPSQAPKQKGTK
jgi:arsenate reductase-like glutaredoxin family protein